MKRTLTIAAMTLTTLLLGAAPALADYPPGPNVSPGEVAPNVIQAPGSLAFTGAEVGVLLAVVFALLAAGVTLLLFGRRRASSTTD